MGDEELQAPQDGLAEQADPEDIDSLVRDMQELRERLKLAGIRKERLEAGSKAAVERADGARRLLEAAK